jgi:hypothetical protein
MRRAECVVDVEDPLLARPHGGAELVNESSHSRAASVLRGAFSRRQIVDCEASAAPLCGQRPTASFVKGSWRSRARPAAGGSFLQPFWTWKRITKSWSRISRRLTAPIASYSHEYVREHWLASARCGRQITGATQSRTPCFALAAEASGFGSPRSSPVVSNAATYRIHPVPPCPVASTSSRINGERDDGSEGAHYIRR